MKSLELLQILLLACLCSSYTISQFESAELSTQTLAFRQLVIRDNLKFIREYNQKKSGTVQLVPHAQFIGNTLEENIQKFISKSNLLTQMKHVEGPKIQVNLRKKVAAGSALDLSGYTFGVYNQGACGNCYAYSTTNGISAQRYISGYSANPLSAQEMSDCSSQSNLSYYNKGCGGGDLQISLWYATNFGLHTESVYPFNTNTLVYGQSQPCNRAVNLIQSASKIRGWGYMGYENNCFNRAVYVANGYTVPTAFFASFATFFYYGSGVFSTSSCPSLPSNAMDHAVLIVGYTYDGTYFGNTLKVKNSWGALWGERGYFRITMAGNPCNVCSYSTPVYL